MRVGSGDPARDQRRLPLQAALADQEDAGERGLEGQQHCHRREARPQTQDVGQEDQAVRLLEQDVVLAQRPRVPAKLVATQNIPKELHRRGGDQHRPQTRPGMPVDEPGGIDPVKPDTRRVASGF